MLELLGGNEDLLFGTAVCFGARDVEKRDVAQVFWNFIHGIFFRKVHIHFHFSSTFLHTNRDHVLRIVVKVVAHGAFNFHACCLLILCFVVCYPQLPGLSRLLLENLYEFAKSPRCFDSDSRLMFVPGNLASCNEKNISSRQLFITQILPAVTPFCSDAQCFQRVRRRSVAGDLGSLTWFGRF